MPIRFKNYCCEWELLSLKSSQRIDAMTAMTNQAFTETSAEMATGTSSTASRSGGTLRLRSGLDRLAPGRCASGAPAKAVQASPAPGPASLEGERSLDSEALLQGRSHVSIDHHGETYQLRATRLGKLILTK
jgi:hemin uptake protein HemP